MLQSREDSSIEHCRSFIVSDRFYIFLKRILAASSPPLKGGENYGDKEGPGKESEKNIKKEITRYDRMDSDSIP